MWCRTGGGEQGGVGLGGSSVTRVAEESHGRSLGSLFRNRLVLPLFADPTTHLSGPDLATAARRAGILATFKASAPPTPANSTAGSSHGEVDRPALRTGALLPGFTP